MNARITRNATALVTIGTSGVQMLQAARAAIVAIFGEVPPFVRTLAIDTTDQVSRDAPRLPDDSFLCIRSPHVRALLDRANEWRREQGLDPVGEGAVVASGEGAGGEAYVAALMLWHRRHQVRDALRRLLEPFQPGRVADLAASCARNPALVDRGVVVRSVPKVDVWFPLSTPGGSSGACRVLQAMLHSAAREYGIQLEVHEVSLLPEVR